jgi:hypothetical protein
MRDCSEFELAVRVPAYLLHCGFEEHGGHGQVIRVTRTITEQSFDVFTVNKAERKIYATKIGAGDDREIAY